MLYLRQTAGGGWGRRGLGSLKKNVFESYFMSGDKSRVDKSFQSRKKKTLRKKTTEQQKKETGGKGKSETENILSVAL